MNIRTQFPDLFLTAMLPALDEVITDNFDRIPSQYTRIFRVMTSDRSIEQTSEVVGLGTFGQMNEGGPIRYDEAVPGFNKTYVHSKYGLGFRISDVMQEDDRFGIINDLAADLGDSARETIEIDAANDFNNGFNGSFPGPDGQPLFSTAHPLVKSGGVQQNTLSVAADLDVASLEMALTDFRTMRKPSGKKMRLEPELLIVPPGNEFIAAEILGGTMRSDTANHTINAFRQREGFKSFMDWMVWDYLTDPDAWFIRASQQRTQLRFYHRRKFQTRHDVDFDTQSLKTIGTMRFSHGWSSFYGIYGSPGA